MKASRTILAAIVAAANLSAVGKELALVPNPVGTSLHIDRSTLKREGSIVSFTYVLASPPGSNAIDAVIDCDAQTYSTHKVVVYPELLAEGVGRIYSDPPKSQTTMRRFHANSSFEYLANYACSR